MNVFTQPNEPPAQQRLAVRTVRSGFTLLELTLVLTIIVLIAALTVPRLGEVFERQKLNGSANTLRLAFDRGRLEAMRTGQAQVFECVLGQGTYTIKPLVLQSDAVNAGAGATVMTGSGTLVETQASGFFTAPDTADPEGESLEEKITFLSCRVSNDLRAYTVAQDAQNSGLGDVNTQTMAQQVFFYPDGSASTAEVQVTNERGDVRAIRIRGLTGHSRVVAIANVASNTDK